MTMVFDHFQLTVTVGGLDDSTQNFSGEMTATTATDAAVDADLVMIALSGVTAGKILGYSISQHFVENAYVRPLSSDAEGGEHATIVVGIEGNPFKKARIGIPFPKGSLFLATYGENYNVVDIEDINIDILVAKFATGGQLYISDGEIADSALSGRRD